MQLIERLESRKLFASFTAASVADLIADISAANAAGGSNTISLAAGSTFKLTDINSATGLPAIAAGDELTIIGNGDIIQRSTTKGTPAFGLIEVKAGGSLTLINLTLSRGLAYSAGGAIRSAGVLSLSGVTIQNCIAQGSLGFGASGGAIFSTGALAISDSTIQNNQALGGNGIPGDGGFNWPGPGGPAYGGAVYIGGSVTVNS